MEKLKILLLFAIGLTSQVLFAQNRTIQGIVTSAEDGEPLIGATVVLKDNPSVGAATDINGRYTFTIPENAKVLVVSYLGMKTQEVRIMRSNKLNIALQPDEHLLQEVVVTGYGNFTRSSFTGSASTVRADMMKDIPVMSVEQKLQGMTSGLTVWFTGCQRSDSHHNQERKVRKNESQSEHFRRVLQCRCELPPHTERRTTPRTAL